MKKHSHNDIEEGLAKQVPDVEMTPSDEFWPDFKARAKMRTQEAPDENRSRPAFLPWATAAACTVILLVSSIVLLLNVEKTTELKNTSVTSLDVMAPHSAVIIMNDDQGDGTVVWIVDMETNGDNV